MTWKYIFCCFCPDICGHKCNHHWHGLKMNLFFGENIYIYWIRKKKRNVCKCLFVRKNTDTHILTHKIFWEIEQLWMFICVYNLSRALSSLVLQNILRHTTCMQLKCHGSDMLLLLVHWTLHWLGYLFSHCTCTSVPLNVVF